MDPFFKNVGFVFSFIKGDFDVYDRNDILHELQKVSQTNIEGSFDF